MDRWQSLSYNNIKETIIISCSTSFRTSERKWPNGIIKITSHWYQAFDGSCDLLDGRMLFLFLQQSLSYPSVKANLDDTCHQYHRLLTDAFPSLPTHRDRRHCWWLRSFLLRCITKEGGDAMIYIIHQFLEDASFLEHTIMTILFGIILKYYFE